MQYIWLLLFVIGLRFNYILMIICLIGIGEPLQELGMGMNA